MFISILAESQAGAGGSGRMIVCITARMTAALTVIAELFVALQIEPEVTQAEWNAAKHGKAGSIFRVALEAQRDREFPITCFCRCGSHILLSPFPLALHAATEQELIEAASELNTTVRVQNPDSLARDGATPSTQRNCFLISASAPQVWRLVNRYGSL